MANVPRRPLVMRAVKKLAVTGGAGEGKSTVVGILRDIGCRVASADEIVKTLWDDPLVQDRVTMALHLPLPLDKATVRNLILSDVAARRELNSIFHAQTIERILADSAEIVEVPLLFESCMQGLFQRVWVVTCGPEEQMNRLVSRLGDKAAAESLVHAQLSSRVKCAFADEVIRTDQPLYAVKHVVESLARTGELV